MTLATRLLPVLDRARGKLGTYGLRRYTVTRRLVTWDGGMVGLGVPTYDDLILSPNPKVQETDDKTITIGHITPAYDGPPAGGYTLEQLRPLTGDPDANENPAQEFYYVVTGPNGTTRYALTDVVSSDGPAHGEGAGSLRYKLVLASLNREGPR